MSKGRGQNPTLCQIWQVHPCIVQTSALTITDGNLADSAYYIFEVSIPKSLSVAGALVVPHSIEKSDVPPGL